MSNGVLFSDVSPTPYPHVNRLLGILFEEVRGVLRAEFVGMYLFGSLAIGDFDEGSDIDVAIITKDEVTRDLFLALRRMHERIAGLDSRWATQMEVSYLSRQALFRYIPQRNLHPQLQRGRGERLVLDNHARVVERHVLREHGIVVAGPMLHDLIAPISPEDLRESAMEILREWGEPMLARSQPFDSRGYQSYTVLSLCRILYTLKHGTVVSKPVAAHWTQQNLGERWRELIENARLSRLDPDAAPEPAQVEGTLELMRFVLEESKR